MLQGRLFNFAERRRIPTHASIPSLSVSTSEILCIGLWSNCGMSFVRNTIEAGRYPEMRIITNLARKAAAVRPSAKTSRSVKSKLRATKAVRTISPATVLVVDDDPSLLRSLNRLVSASGFLVKTFARPSELLASDTPRSNACMVVDIDMPEMTGIEMCEALKGLGRGLPAILITGRTDARTRSLAAHSLFPQQNDPTYNKRAGIGPFGLTDRIRAR